MQVPSSNKHHICYTASGEFREFVLTTFWKRSNCIGWKWQRLFDVRIIRPRPIGCGRMKTLARVIIVLPRASLSVHAMNESSHS